MTAPTPAAPEYPALDPAIIAELREAEGAEDDVPTDLAAAIDAYHNGPLSDEHIQTLMHYLRRDAAELARLREQLRDAKADAERAKEERNRIRVELEREWRGNVDAATARGDRLAVALVDAASSLRTISLQAGKDEYMKEIMQIRGYANGRALAADAALAEEARRG